MREPDAHRCHREGHLPAVVAHLPDWRTRLTCPRCGKSVIEKGLSDHPDAAKGPRYDTGLDDAEGAI